MTTPDYVIVSVDIETTATKLLHGDILSIGAATLWPDDFDRMETFYQNLEPLLYRHDPDTMRWWEQWPERWAETQVDKASPLGARMKFRDWVNTLGADPVFMAWPGHFDFGWVDLWFTQVGIDNPFSYKPLDQISYIAGTQGNPYIVKGSRSRGTLHIPESWEEEAEKKHNALEDAIAQRNGFVQTLRDTQK